MAKIKTIPQAELAPNSVAQFYLADETAVAIYNLEGDYFATDDVCTHGQAFLSEGEIREGQIVCPYHEGSFDIKTGEPVDPPCVVPLRKYAAQAGADGYIYLETPD